MFVELHMIQNFAPACLNRDDTNAPKDCEFGGYRRARISSQCIKRAIRRHFREQNLLAPEHLSQRTKRLVEMLAQRLADRGKEAAQAHQVAETAIQGAGLGLQDGLTEYLLFLGEGEVEALAGVILEHWDALAEIAPSSGAESQEGAEQKTRQGRKKDAKAAVPADVRKALLASLDGGKAADLALFGRMLADMPDKNIDAASQVAHAISTHKASMEMDFYTAVDDLNPEEETGAGMMGTVEFNSSCFYRYALIDVNQLAENLDGDVELARRTIEAFLRAAVAAIPTGKQNSMAAQNPPSLILAVVRENGVPWSLANAFVHPVRPTRDKSLIQNSVEALDAYWGRLVSVYGTDGVKTRPVCQTDGTELAVLGDQQRDSFDQVVEAVMEVLPQ